MQSTTADSVNPHQRITGRESMIEAIQKLSEGNPGAVSVIVQLLQEQPRTGTGFMMVLYLDSIGVYSSNIWVLYKDCCREDIGQVQRVLVAWLRGRLNLGEIHQHIRTSTPFGPLPTIEDMMNAPL